MLFCIQQNSSVSVKGGVKASSVYYGVPTERQESWWYHHAKFKPISQELVYDVYTYISCSCKTQFMMCLSTYWSSSLIGKLIPCTRKEVINKRRWWSINLVNLVSQYSCIILGPLPYYYSKIMNGKLLTVRLRAVLYYRSIRLYCIY